MPADWQSVPGMDIHFADSIRLPAAESFSNTFQSIENSPTVYGYDIAIVQFNGFLGYDCDNVKGVQKLHWNPDLNQWEIDWVNRQINMNGVLTYSKGANTVYGSGKEEDCNYFYYGLDWETGDLNLRYQLGPEGTFLNDPFYDAGNNNLIDEQGNIYFPGGASLVKVEIVAPLTSTSPPPGEAPPTLFPNPTSGFVTIDSEEEIQRVTVFTINGELVKSGYGDRQLDVSALANGLYVVKINLRHGTSIQKLVKRNGG